MRRPVCHDRGVRRLLPVPVREDLDLDAQAAHYAYPSGGALRANMVVSVDGAVTLEGRSEGVSNAADWRLFGLQRALADVILVGAGTARTEGYGPGRARAEFAHLRRAAGQEPAPRLALVTRSGAVDPQADVFGGATPTLVIAPARADAERLDALRAVADVVVCGEDEVDLTAARRELQERGLRRILSEGGPHLLGSLLDAGELDEVAMSITPTVVGGDSDRMISHAHAVPRAMTRTGLLEEDGTLFLHYRRDAEDQEGVGEASR